MRRRLHPVRLAPLGVQAAAVDVGDVDPTVALDHPLAVDLVQQVAVGDLVQQDAEVDQVAGRALGLVDVPDVAACCRV